MKYAIITPTYLNHFIYIDKYLKSFCKFVEDKKDIPIVFTISKTENSKFQKIIEKYKSEINIIVLFFEDLLKENNVDYSLDDYMKIMVAIHSKPQRNFTRCSTLTLRTFSFWIAKVCG